MQMSTIRLDAQCCTLDQVFQLRVYLVTIAQEKGMDSTRCSSQRGVYRGFWGQGLKVEGMGAGDNEDTGLEKGLAGGGVGVWGCWESVSCFLALFSDWPFKLFSTCM
eukprot:scaffold162918_cov23-Tisochrysis_lutea.AAC.1